MEKITPFLYRYIYFFDTKETIRLDHKLRSIPMVGIVEAIKDEEIESWTNATLITGGEYFKFFNKDIPPFEHECWFSLKEQPFMPKGLLRKALIAKPFYKK